jgi:RNA-directed DNA polymerase
MITVPEAKLLRVQRWIHQQVLLPQQYNRVSTAFATGCDPISNAAIHCEARWLVKIDITNFFESISERQVYYAFCGLGYPRLLSFQLTRLCTRVAPGSKKYERARWQGPTGYKIFPHRFVGHLPQGAPTSPLLANLVCAGLDNSLAELAARYNCMVSRYADDVVFSGTDLGREPAIKLIAEVSAAFGKLGFDRNRRKTHIVSPGARKIVTGLLVDSRRPRLTRAFRDRLRLHLYHAATKGIPEHCLRRKFRSIIGFREHLNGLITYAENVDVLFGARCREQFRRLNWQEFAPPAA